MRLMPYERLIAAMTTSAFLHLAGLAGLSLLPIGDGSGLNTQGLRKPLTAAFRSAPPSQMLVAQDEVAALKPESKPEEPVAPATQLVESEKHAEAAPAAEKPGSEGLLPDLYYYRAREVEVLATPQGEISPDSKILAGIQHSSAYLVIELLINEAGGVDKATVLESKPEGVFDSLEASAFMNARFTPAIKDGKPVKSRMKFGIRYTTEPLETGPVQPVVKIP